MDTTAEDDQTPSNVDGASEADSTGTATGSPQKCAAPPRKPLENVETGGDPHPAGPGAPTAPTVPATSDSAAQEIWVETKTDSGKSYYYHSVTRETTWNRPAGPNVRIVSQAELEQINAAKTVVPMVPGNVPHLDANRHPMLFGAPPPRFSLPPPMGMPPPGFAPPNWMIPPSAAAQVPAPGGPMPIDPALMAKASEWTEHKSPDGRTFYFNASKNQSVWEKPEVLVQLEASRMASQQHMAKSLPLLQHPPLLPLHPHHQPPMMPPQLGPPPTVLAAPGAAWMQQVLVAEAQKRHMEERAKQELDERMRGQKPAAVDKSKPVSSTPITGTPWCVVWTGDARVFFYNPSTKVSVWERPEELADRADVTKAMSTVPEALLATHPGNVVPRAAVTHTPATADPTSATARAESDSEPEEEEGDGEGDGVPSKKFKGDDTDNRLQNNTASAAEAEAQAAKERSTIPLEQRVASFKEMLREKDVSAFSTWEKELHKIVFDPRYLLLTSRERKQVFEKYVKDRAEEERKEKRTKLRQKAADFRALMESAGLHGKSSFSEFAQKYAKDERLRAVEKMRERESLFNEFIIEVRKREKEEAQKKREQAKLDYIQMLRKHPHVDRHSRWSDVRKFVEATKECRALESKELREELFNEYLKQVREERRRRDKDKKGGDDDETTAPEAGEEQEEDAAEDEEEKLRRQKELERQLRAEASLREREKEVQRTLAGHLRERDSKREHHKKGEAISQFTALLTDLVRNSDLAWKEVKRQLRKDHRYPSIEEALEREERERLFNEHIQMLEKKKRDKYRELLDEIPNLDINSSWKEVKRIIRDDPRYMKYNSSEKCEREFREYLRDKVLDKTIAFRELLEECKLINHKSLELVRENPAHIHEIEDILRIDKRFLDMDHVPEERHHMIMAHLEELFKRGPPPPPTAATATRRKPQ